MSNKFFGPRNAAILAMVGTVGYLFFPTPASPTTYVHEDKPAEEPVLTHQATHSRLKAARILAPDGHLVEDPTLTPQVPQPGEVQPKHPRRPHCQAAAFHNASDTYRR